MHPNFDSSNPHRTPASAHKIEALQHTRGWYCGEGSEDDGDDLPSASWCDPLEGWQNYFQWRRSVENWLSMHGLHRYLEKREPKPEIDPRFADVRIKRSWRVSKRRNVDDDPTWPLEVWHRKNSFVVEVILRTLTKSARLHFPDNDELSAYDPWDQLERHYKPRLLRHARDFPQQFESCHYRDHTQNGPYKYYDELFIPLHNLENMGSDFAVPGWFLEARFFDSVQEVHGPIFQTWMMIREGKELFGDEPRETGSLAAIDWIKPLADQVYVLEGELKRSGKWPPGAQRVQAQSGSARKKRRRR